MNYLPKAFSPEALAELLSEDAKAEMARPVSPIDPRNAELMPVTPGWYVIETYAQRERNVLGEMAARRFGVYLPEVQQTIIKRGRKIDKLSLLFPGYLFVFVWDVLEHRARIEAIDGVLRVILDVNGIPLEVDDETVDEIRAVENGGRPLPGKRKRRHLRRHRYDDDVMAVRSWSPFDDRLLTLDSEGRNQTLRKALGLGS